jgi:hypothetical protein
MTETRHPVTGKIIEAFSAGLSDSARAQISSAQLAELAGMTDQALDAEAGAVAGTGGGRRPDPAGTCPRPGNRTVGPLQQ